MTSFTGFSFIIPHREHDDIAATVDSIKNSILNCRIPFEIISVVGNHPTYQRNHAAQKAKYSHLYFLDNDSILNEQSIKKSIEIFKKDPSFSKRIALTGGPSLLLQPASYLEECINAVLTSKEVVGKIRARYSQVGKPRFSNDQELILCNLIIEKKHFIKLKQFDTKLYPNEENDFIYRLLFYQNISSSQEIGRVFYHPEIVVHRPQRKSLKSFISQMIHYGRGRAEQTKNNFRTLHLHLLLAIPFFLLIFLFLFFSLKYYFSPLNSSSLIVHYSHFFFKQFSLLYFLYTTFIFVKTSSRRRKWLFYTPFLTFCCHFFYGLGLFLGLLQKGFKSEKKKIWFKIKKIRTP